MIFSFISLHITLLFQHFNLVGVFGLTVSFYLYYRFCKSSNFYVLLASSSGKMLILSGLASLGYAVFYISFCLKVLGSHVFALFTFLSIPAIFILLLKFYSYLYENLIVDLKSYTLFFIVLVIIGVVLSIYLTVNFNEVLYEYDIVYSFDPVVRQDLSLFDVFHAEEDLRHSLLCIFSIPFYWSASMFTLLNKTVSLFLFYFINFCLVILCIIILCKLLRLEQFYERVIFILFSLSIYSNLLSVIFVEKFVISCFYCLLFVNNYVSEKDCRFSFFGCIGTTTTSAVLGIFCLDFKKGLKNVVKQFFSIVFDFLIFIVFFTRLDVFSSGSNVLLSNLTICDKLYMYTHFIKNCFIYNDFTTGKNMIIESNVLSVLEKSYNSLSIAGIVLLFIMLVSFVFNRKDKLTQVSFCWLLLSVFLFVITGLGVGENCLIIYSFYFSWSFIILLYKFIEFVLKKKTIFTLIPLSVVFYIINMQTIFKILNHIVSL